MGESTRPQVAHKSLAPSLIRHHEIARVEFVAYLAIFQMPETLLHGDEVLRDILAL